MDEFGATSQPLEGGEEDSFVKIHEETCYLRPNANNLAVINVVNIPNELDASTILKSLTGLRRPGQHVPYPA